MGQGITFKLGSIDSIELMAVWCEIFLRASFRAECAGHAYLSDRFRRAAGLFAVRAFELAGR